MFLFGICFFLGHVSLWIVIAQYIRLVFPCRIRISLPLIFSYLIFAIIHMLGHEELRGDYSSFLRSLFSLVGNFLTFYTKTGPMGKVVLTYLSCYEKNALSNSWCYILSYVSYARRIHFFLTSTSLAVIRWVRFNLSPLWISKIKVIWWYTTQCYRWHSDSRQSIF